MIIKPSSLKPGDTIGVMAPSSRVDKSKLDTGLAALQKRGYKVDVHPQTYAQFGGLAGTDKEKAQALHDLFVNPDINAIIFARGGNGAGGMRAHLDFKLIKANPKIVMGYSDVTALLNSIYKQTGLITFHGPLIHNVANHLDDTLAFLSGQNAAKTLNFNKGRPLQAGQASGPIIGGNLSLFQAMIGTPWMPETENAILLLEDVSDEISRYDRMFAHLKEAGILGTLGGIVIGQFTDTMDSGTIPFDLDLETVVKRHTDNLDIPVIIDAPFGHGNDQRPFAIGMPSVLKADANGYSLTLSSSPFQNRGAGPSTGSVPYQRKM